MTDATKDLRDVLEADARRRARAGAVAAPAAADSGDHDPSFELRFRLINTLPRQTRPLFAALRATLAPYGYTLSPLYPAPDLTPPRMQTELARTSPDDPSHYAPLVFELDHATSLVRVYVRQFGGRSAPDFPERHIDLASAPDLPAMEAALNDYVRCMLVPHPAAAA
jgi:hypothetical protein